jgi:hypothetical protein
VRSGVAEVVELENQVKMDLVLELLLLVAMVATDYLLLFLEFQ